ncbi:methyl-accepting chemotaxis protein [Arenibaculum pallidiluteum]|uniref:methyl-accepting chemotaxis protein n=1 Tax=Arenibaculum pallidiluteum TaxID=2812559 RepID=UPI001A95F4DA|nr:HAMP domain-containing methyl-accepting chemotaxis protein [Arenibaculum pallidiluteum]
MSLERLKLSSWGFALKFTVAPGVAIALTCLLAYFGTLQLNGQVEQSRTIVDRNMEGAIRLSDIAARIQAANGALFSILSHQAANDSGGKGAEQIAALAKRLDGIIADLQQYRDGYASPDQVADVESVTAELTKYKEATAFVAAMMEIDFASVVSFMKPFEANFDHLSKLTGKIVSASVADSRSRAAASADQAESTVTAFVVITAIATALVALLTWLIGHNTSRSVGAIASATLKLADGDTNVDIDRLGRRDELGAIVRSLSVFRENIVKVREMQAEQERLRAESEAERQRAMSELAEGFEASVKRVVQTVSEASAGLKASASTMRGAADDAYRQSSEVANAGQEVTSNVTTVATAVEEMSASIGEIARQVENSARISRDAVERARRTDDDIGQLAELAERIGDIVAIIQGIAGQTNLLALNATIEAARAGEAGKGFAVVASEVKNLATQTARATEEIGGQIQAIQTRTKQSVESIREITETISHMNEIASGIASAVEQQSSATQEISRNVQQAAASTGAVSHTIAEVRDAARTVGDSADHVLTAAEDLTQQSSSLGREVDAFLMRVRG